MSASADHLGESQQTDTGQAGDESASESGDVPVARQRWKKVLRWTGIAFAVVFALIVVGAVVPVSSSGLDARPEPTSTYDEAMARFDEVTADEDELGVTDACRSRRFVHGEATDVAVVLFHGLTNCPKQFVEFAEHLHEDGANVIILRAPHHGLGDETGAIDDVSRVGPLSVHELRDYADDSIDIATGLGDTVQVVGLSMGGVLAMWTAEFRDDVDLVVAVAPAISIPGVPHFVTTAFINLFDRLPNFSLPSPGVKLDHTYSGESTGALASMFLLARATENELTSGRSATDQVVVVLNPDDDQVDNDEVAQLVVRWADEDGSVEIVMLSSSGLPHDVIDPDQPEGNVGGVYPVLFDLLGKSG